MMNFSLPSTLVLFVDDPALSLDFELDTTKDENSVKSSYLCLKLDNDQLSHAPLWPSSHCLTLGPSTLHGLRIALRNCIGTRPHPFLHPLSTAAEPTIDKSPNWF